MKDFNDIYSHSAINDFIFFESRPMQTQVGIILGNGCVSGNIAREGANLYKQGLIKKIIVTGGVPAKNPPFYEHLVNTGFSVTEEDFTTDKSEADYMQHVLINEGVNLSDIIYTDRQSTNTGENFENIEPAMRAFGIKSAAVIGVAYASRRAYQTAKRVMPDLDFHPHPVYPYGLSREQWRKNWPTIDFAKKIIIAERAKLDHSHANNYYECGHCVDVAFQPVRREKTLVPVIR